MQSGFGKINYLNGYINLYIKFDINIKHFYNFRLYKNLTRTRTFLL